MKKILILLCVLGAYGCSPKIQPTYSAQVNFVSKEEQGTITVNSNGFGKNEDDAIHDAHVNAFNIVLFKGIPGTDISVPLIENETEAKSNHKQYFDKLFVNGFYQNFLMSSYMVENPDKLNKGVYCSVNLKINYNSLRKDLVQNNIIRKFGF